MILQELCAYYDRLSNDPYKNIPKQGYVSQNIAFELVITSEGDFKNINIFRDDKGRPSQKSMILPGPTKPSGQGINPSLQGWDRTDYMLGYTDYTSLKTEKEKISKKKKCPIYFNSFRESYQAVSQELNSDDLYTFYNFLKRWNPLQAESIAPDIKEVSGLFGVVRISTKSQYLHDLFTPKIPTSIDEKPARPCLISGNNADIARIHDIKIKGVQGAMSAGAAIVSFNKNAFESYGKEQSHNAPISQRNAFQYTTALNYLLRKDSKQKIQIGDTSCVFWSESSNTSEALFSFGLNIPEAEDNKRTQEMATLFKRLTQGETQVPDKGTRFFILGLSPNSARLSIRFWMDDDINLALNRVINHQKLLDIIRAPHDREFIPPWLILLQTARENKDVAPQLAGDLLRSILTESRYPETLLYGIIRRIRADQAINHPRAATIKAILIRNYHKEITPMLDPNRTEKSYQLGRLFAALEKAQEDALPSISSTIKDKFFSSASTTPVTVFSRLIRLSQHHIAKLDGGIKVNTEKRIQEIMGNISEFPRHLNLADQGLFALGYYHQRQNFFAKKTTNNTPSNENNKESQS